MTTKYRVHHFDRYMNANRSEENSVIGCLKWNVHFLIESQRLLHFNLEELS